MTQKTILITGASSGIGYATAEHFAKEGHRLILTARRIERIEDLKKELVERYGVEVLCLQLDVQDRAIVEQAFSSLPANWQDIDVLVNNAGLALSTSTLQEGSIDQWDQMIDTNVKGLLYVTRAILPGMVGRKSGHVINIGSIAGHEYYPGGNVYCATKHAVKAITKNMRIDLLGTPVRVTSIDPGAVATEFSQVRWNDKKRSDEFYEQFQPLKAEDIASAILYCANTPEHVNVAEMIVMPTCQASANHLSKKS